MNAIVAVPKLYVQVIHLMNKMNLPPPFGEATTMTPMLYNYFYKNKTETKKRKKRDELLSSDESELESDNDNINNNVKQENLPINDLIKTTKITHPNKKTKLTTSQNEILIKINVENKSSENKNENISIENNDVIDISEINTNMPTENNEVIDISEINTNMPTENNEAIDNNKINTNIIKKYKPNKNYISIDDLQKNKISQEEMVKLPAYRNYREGIPSRTLFLKNVNVKLTKEKDLEYIFGRYLNDEEIKDKLQIRLMTSGRMKGQAFIKLPTVEMASLLLKEVHGYILNEKALIIQYGKSSD